MNASKNLIATLALAAAAWGHLTPTLAHGDAAPKHGGVVQSANDLSFELVAQAEGATLYIEDHGEAMATVGFTGKLMVLQGGAKTEAPLTPAGDNKLAAAGVKLAPGTKAVAVLTTPQKQTLSVRFTVK